MLRVAVFDDDREMIGQRFLPVNAIRPGFQAHPLRDRHNQPLPLSMLFVHVKVEDWVPGWKVCVCVCVCEYMLRGVRER